MKVITRDLSEICGALLVIGFPGTSLDQVTARTLRDGRAAGVILFRRNVESVAQVHALAMEIAASAHAEGAFIAVDQEGGSVKRIPLPAIALPPMRALGTIDDVELTRRAGIACGRELAALGFNLDFAPVLDVDSNPQNPVIGDRSFGRDPSLVSRHGIAFAEGLESTGVLACGKHFPGHGDTDADSHHHLPVVKHSVERLRATEIAPFQQAASRIGAFMTAHVVYEALDRDVTATHSVRIATDLLRGELGFRGLLFSDDLEMRAVSDRHSVEESAVAAIRAGCDVLLVCKDGELAARAHAALVREAERDRAFRHRCEEAAARSVDARRRFPSRPKKPSEFASAFDTPFARDVLADIGRLTRGA